MKLSRRTSRGILLLTIALALIAGWLGYQSWQIARGDDRPPQYAFAPPPAVEVDGDPLIVDADKLSEPVLPDEEFLAVMDQANEDAQLVLTLSPDPTTLRERTSGAAAASAIGADLAGVAQNIGGEALGTIGTGRLVDATEDGARVAFDVIFTRVSDNEQFAATFTLVYAREGSTMTLTGLDVAGVGVGG